MAAELRGYLLVLLATTSWGASGVVAKMLCNQRIDPMVVLQMRMNLGLAFLLLIMLLFRRKALKIKLRDIPFLAMYGIFAISLMQYSYYVTLDLTNVGTAIFLQYLAPIFVAIFSAVFLRERMTKIKITAVILAVAGTFLIIAGSKIGFKINPLGLATGLLSAGLLAFQALWSKKGTARYSPWTMLFYGTLIGTLLWTVINPPWVLAKSHFSTSAWGLFIFLSLFAAIIPYWLHLLGLRHLLATKASICSTFETVAGSFFAFILLGETMSPLQALGSGLILTSIISIQFRRENPAADEALPETPDRHQSMSGRKQPIP